MKQEKKMKTKETILYKSNKYKIILREPNNIEAINFGYKAHVILLIQEGNNKAWFNVRYTDNDFTIEKAEYLKWFLPNYVLDKLRDSIEIYNRAANEEI